MRQINWSGTGGNVATQRSIKLAAILELVGRRLERDLERPIMKQKTVHIVYGEQSLLASLELHKAVALALTRLRVLDHIHAAYSHWMMGHVGEKRVQIVFGGVRSDSVHVNDVAHVARGRASASACFI